MPSISSRLQFLVKYVKIPPEMWDFIIPYGPILKSPALKELAMAGVVRDIALQIPNRDIAERVKSVGKSMADFAASGLVAGWDDGDDICPPWHPFPFPYPVPDPDPYPWYINPLSELNPQPLPPRSLGSALKVIASLTSLDNAAGELKELGKQLSDQQFT